MDFHDLAGRLLGLAELTKKVPEAGLSNNLVGGEQSHAVHLLCSVVQNILVPSTTWSLGTATAARLHTTRTANHVEL